MNEVSVVIPTTGRASLVSAVASAARQARVGVEIIVVSDTEEASAIPASVTAQAHRSLATGGSRGGAYARALGTSAASCEWVAYLDDDDTWHPDKLARQLQVAATAKGSVPILSCLVRSLDLGSNARVEPIPMKAFAEEMPLDRWLFYRRRLDVRRNLIPTSTILLPTELARAVKWNSDISRHHDWDFLLRARAESGTRIFQLPEVLVEISVGASSSMTERSDWRASLEWAQSMRQSWDDDTYSDFLAGQVLRYAIQTRDLRAIRQVLSEIRRAGWPSLSACVIAGAGLVSRARFNSIVHRRGHKPKDLPITGNSAESQ